MFGGFGGGIESIFIRISFDMDSPFNSTINSCGVTSSASRVLKT